MAHNPPSPDQHIVQDRVDEDKVHVLQLSDEEGAVDEVPISPIAPASPISPRTFVHAFPRAEFSTMVEGLSKHSWHVYPGYMRTCLDSTVALCSTARYGERMCFLGCVRCRMVTMNDSQTIWCDTCVVDTHKACISHITSTPHTPRGPSYEDAQYIHRLLTDLLPNTVQKCCQEHFVRGWAANILKDIAHMLASLVCLAKHSMWTVVQGEWIHNAAYQEQLLSILQCLCVALDANNSYHMVIRYGGCCVKLQWCCCFLRVVVFQPVCV